MTMLITQAYTSKRLMKRQRGEGWTRRLSAACQLTTRTCEIHPPTHLHTPYIPPSKIVHQQTKLLNPDTHLCACAHHFIVTPSHPLISCRSSRILSPATWYPAAHSAPTLRPDSPVLGLSTAVAPPGSWPREQFLRRSDTATCL
jgi:hypothetical protein